MTEAQAQLKGENYFTEIEVAGHTFVSDESLKVGGQNKGPNPHDLVAAALASCTSITLKMYLNHKQWPHKELFVTVRLSGSDNITFHRNIRVTGTFTEEQKQRLLQVANACPIHKLLVNQVSIQTEIQ